MIFHDVEPTDDVAVVSLQRVGERLKLKNHQNLWKLARDSMKYAFYTCPRDDEQDYEKFKSDIHHGLSAEYLSEHHTRLMMPLDTAWRLIKDAEAGLILAKAERLA